MASIYGDLGGWFIIVLPTLIHFPLKPWFRFKMKSRIRDRSGGVETN